MSEFYFLDLELNPKDKKTNMRVRPTYLGD